MTTLYYIDANNFLQTADITLLNYDTQAPYKNNPLHGMVKGGHGAPIKRVEQMGAYYASNMQDAQWWIDYARNYNATQEECMILLEVLRGSCLVVLKTVAHSFLGPLHASVDVKNLPDVIVGALQDGFTPPSYERAAFRTNREALLKAIKEITK